MYTLINPALTKALTHAEAKAHLRVIDTSEDLLIQSLLNASQEIAEVYTNRAFIRSTWSYTLDEFPGYIKIGKSPISAVNSIKYIDGDGVEQTLAADQYEVKLSEPTIIIPKSAWPGTENGIGKVTVTFTAGWQDASYVPATIKAAMCLIIGHLYDNRSDVVEGRLINEMPMGSKYLLNQWKVFV